MALNIAVFAPTATARIAIETMALRGERRSRRAAYLRSFQEPSSMHTA